MFLDILYEVAYNHSTPSRGNFMKFSNYILPWKSNKFWLIQTDVNVDPEMIKNLNTQSNTQAELQFRLRLDIIFYIYLSSNIKIEIKTKCFRGLTTEMDSNTKISQSYYFSLNCMKR